MRRVAVVPTIRKQEDTLYTSKTVAKLLSCAFEVWMDQQYSNSSFAPGVRFAAGDSVYSNADWIVVLGGDGSMLRAAKSAVRHDIPLIGINLGRLGYTAELEKDELELLEKIGRNEYSIERRMMLSVLRVDPAGRRTICESALNDVVVARGGYSKIVDLKLCADGKSVRTIRADGIIFATPTGSTAYSMTAGGSVLDPTLECICATPVCPLSRYARPIVFSGNSVLELENVGERGVFVGVTVDGSETLPLAQGEKIVIRRSDLHVQMLTLKNDGFFGVLNNKLSEYELKN